jgi:hypothetical protein
MLARPILTLPCISLEDYVFSASGRHKRGGPDFGRGLYLFSRLSWRPPEENQIAAPKMVDLSESAKTILRHFKVRGMHEKDYETPAALGQLFNHPQECESAEAELVTAGLVDLAAGPGGHIPVRNWNRNRIRGAALTLDGERYVAQNRL